MNRRTSREINAESEVKSLLPYDNNLLWWGYKGVVCWKVLEKYKTVTKECFERRKKPIVAAKLSHFMTVRADT